MNILIITNTAKDKGGRITRKTAAFLKAKGVKVSLRKGDAPLDIPEETDLLLVLGGDGTLLQASRAAVERRLPLLGINLGNLGFLAEVSKKELFPALEQLVSGKYRIEERMMLYGKLMRGNEKLTGERALNDIVLTRAGSLRIMHYEVFVNGAFLASFHSDGLIFSTPTGSTGYNMSAGGPIIEPNARLVLLTSISSHALNTRSIVLAPEDVLSISLEKSSYGDAEVYFDGGSRELLTKERRLVVRQSRKVTRIIRLKDTSFLEILNRKLS